MRQLRSVNSDLSHKRRAADRKRRAQQAASETPESKSTIRGPESLSEEGMKRLLRLEMKDFKVREYVTSAGEMKRQVMSTGEILGLTVNYLKIFIIYKFISMYILP